MPGAGHAAADRWSADPPLEGGTHRLMRQGLELLAMMMIGDGLIASLRPRSHLRLWRAGPAPWRRLVLEMERRPALSAAVGAAEAALGLWLVFRLLDSETRGDLAG